MIGYLACILVTLAYLPQAITSYKTKQCAISGNTMLLLLAGMMGWAVHALIVSDFALLTSSVLSLIQLGFISQYKLGRRTHEQQS